MRVTASKVRVLAKADRFDGLNAGGQEVRIDDPDRPIEILDVRIGYRRAFSGAVRAGDDPELRTIKLFGPARSAEPELLLVFAACPARRSFRNIRSDRRRKSRCSHPAVRTRPRWPSGLKEPLLRDGCLVRFSFARLCAGLRGLAYLSSILWSILCSLSTMRARLSLLRDGTSNHIVRYRRPTNARSSLCACRPRSCQDTSPPSRRIMSAKPGKLVAMKARVVDRHGRSDGEPQHQRRHGDAVVHVGGDEAAAGGHGRGRARSGRRRRSRPRCRSPAASRRSRRGGRIP